MKRNRRGQVTMEVAVLITAIAAALIFMLGYVQRGAQGGAKGNADSLGQQFSTTGAFNSYSQQNSASTKVQAESTSCSDYTHGVGGAAAAATTCVPTADPSGLGAPPVPKL